VSAPVDRDQLAALRRLREAFGDVQALEVVDLEAGRDPAVQASKGELFDSGEGRPSWRPSRCLGQVAGDSSARR
jgi:hypothetical protein